METYFDITPDLCASLLENGTWLEIESESLDKRDCYAFKPDPGAEGEFNWEYTEWALSDKLGGLTEAELAVRGLPNYSEEGSGDWSGWLWEKNPAFVAWANAALDKATAAALAAAEKDDEEDDADAIFESRNP